MSRPGILVVGYGRIGHLAARLLSKSWRVSVIERGRAPRLPVGIARVSAERIGDFPVVIFALPADDLKSFLEAHAPAIAPGAFVADLCAVKEAPMRWMRRLLPPGVSFAGLHPLFGPDGVAAGESPLEIAVCPGRMSASCRRRLRKSLTGLGLKPIETTPATHDRTMASTLFLTQIVGLSAGRASRAPLPFVTGGYRHLRVVIDRSSGNSADLLGELLRWNRHAGGVLRRFASAARGIARARNG